MAQRFLQALVGSAPNQIDVKKVLPRLAPQGPGLDLGEIQIAQRERAQASKQRAGYVARGEYQGGLPLSCGATRGQDGPVAVQQKEPGEVAPVVLNGAPQNRSAINGGGHAGCDSGSRWELLFHHHLCTAGGIVKRHSLDPRMAREKIEALVERNRMRINAAHVLE